MELNKPTNEMAADAMKNKTLMVNTERSQYITKFPSSSVLRVSPERIDKNTAAEACFAIKEEEQESFLERFLSFSEQIRGAQLHLLKYCEESEIKCAFFNAIKEISAGNKDVWQPNSLDACLEVNLCNRMQRDGYMVFRIIEGAIDVDGSHLSCGQPDRVISESDGISRFGQLSNLLTHVNSQVQVYYIQEPNDSNKTLVSNHSTADISIDASRSTSNDETYSFENEDPSFLKKYMKSDVKVYCQKVVYSGSLIPQALDDTLVIEQIIKLKSTPYKEKRQEGDEMTNDNALSRLEDILHTHAYKGVLSIPIHIDANKPVGRNIRRASGPRNIDASISALMDPTNPTCVSIFYHFRDNIEADFCINHKEWKALQESLMECGTCIDISTYRGLIHTCRDITGLCTGKPPCVEGTGVSASQYMAFRAPRDTYDWGSQNDGSAIVKDDPGLHICVSHLQDRFSQFRKAIAAINNKFGSLSQFADGSKIFGFHRIEDPEIYGKTGWLYREWLPHAKQVCLFGDFNDWNRASHPLTREKSREAPYHFETPIFEEEATEEKERDGVWSIFLADKSDGSWVLEHKSRVRVHIDPEEGEPIDRVPAYSKVVWKSEDSGLFNSVIWAPTTEEQYTFMHKRPCICSTSGMRIYEAHIGASTAVEGNIGTFEEFKNNVLPRIAISGYNTVLLLDAIEHADYSSFGIYTTNPFAISSRYGTVEEFKALVDTAHKFGIRMCLSVSHAFASKNAMEGLGNMDGSNETYFVSGPSGDHVDFDQAKLFNTTKSEVLRYLMSNIKFLLDEYMIDGFRFEDISSMIYTHRGVGHTYDPLNYGGYFTKELHMPGIVHLCLINALVQTLQGEQKESLPAPKTTPEGNGIELCDSDTCMCHSKCVSDNHRFALLSIANEATAFPSLCRCVWKGGMGFNYRYTSEVGQSIRQMIHSSGHRHGRWILSRQIHELTRRPNTEPLISALDDADSSRLCKRPMLIALFSWESLHTHAVGGVAPHVTELGAALCRLGHDVHIFVRATGMSNCCSVHYGVKYHECTFQLNSDFVIEIQNMCSSFIQSMLSVEEGLGMNFDICHAHDWLAAKAAIEAKQLGRATVLTMHSTEFGRCGNNSYGGMSKRIRDIEAEGCHIVDRVICVSGVLASEVTSQYGVHPAKLTVIYNGINCSSFDGSVDSGHIKRDYGINDMDPMFLFVGRMVVQKGPDLLLEAIPHVLRFRGDTKFVLVGDGHLMQQLKNRAAQLNITHAVRFVGKMSGPPLYALFKSCDAVIVPSRNEPFGIVVLEAWSAGKPVVATNSGGPRDFVNPNNTGILVDPNPGSISWGCCEILKDFDHARWMGSRGRVTAAFHFSWDSIAQRTRDIYYEQQNKHDLTPPRTFSPKGDETTSFSIMGSAMYNYMSIHNENCIVSQGLARWRIYKLLVSALTDGCLNFMANEFAYPDGIDLPRPATQFSNARAFIRWMLSEQDDLKFSHCSLFDACLQRWTKMLGFQNSRHQYLVVCDEEKQVVILERGNCLFAFNFHPTVSYDGYHVGSMFNNSLSVVFSTDEERFGGHDRLTKDTQHPALSAKDGRPYSVKIYLPSNTGIVYGATKDLDSIRRASEKDEVLTASIKKYVGLLKMKKTLYNN